MGLILVFSRLFKYGFWEEVREMAYRGSTTSLHCAGLPVKGGEIPRSR